MPASANSFRLWPGGTVASTIAEARTAGVWPASTYWAPSGDLDIGGVSMTEMVERYGSPAYVLDEAEVRQRCRAYRAAFPGAEIAYAAKAFLCRGIAHWVAEEGLGLDVCSAGELDLGRSAGVPVDRMLLHGNAKSPSDLDMAMHAGIGRIVVDSCSELPALVSRLPVDHRQRVLLRVTPNIAAGGHSAVQTGTSEQKFGVSITDGSAEYATKRILHQPELELVGLHCHLGSQITSTRPYVLAVRRLVGMLARIRAMFGVELTELDLGGGHAVAYRSGDEVLDIHRLADAVHRELRDACYSAEFPEPQLIIEPGRAIVGPAGVALYRVLSVKHVGNWLFVAIDGGMSDNPRPALYGVHYTLQLIGRHSSADLVPTVVVGRHCEAGDIVADDVALPADVHPGDVIAVPVAGAYHLSMASEYNMVGRPPVVAVIGGQDRLLVRREGLADLNAREVGT